MGTRRISGPSSHDAEPGTPDDAGTLPESPKHLIPMSSGVWRFSLGPEHDGPAAMARGVYMLSRTTGGDAYWQQVADLPHVHARVIRRDGSGRRVATDYVLADGETGDRDLFNHQTIRSGEWANALGMVLSDDDRITKATATAIRRVAKDAPLQEATPSAAGQGHIHVPVPECLPFGYLATAPDVTRAEALTKWRGVVELAAHSPRMALALAAVASAPFVRPLDRQSHFVHLFGESDQGKSTTVHMCAGVWGDPHTGAVLRSWNTTGIALGRLLGTLAILPPILDEAGMARFDPKEWGRVIYQLCDGAQRTAGENKAAGGIRASAPWHGTLISAGNGRITQGVTSGAFVGIPKRVIELRTPFTLCAEDAEAIKPKVLACYGHLGAEIIARYRVADVADLISHQAQKLLPLPAGGNARTLGKHLQGHIAGAIMVDTIVGTGTLLRDATVQAAREYLAENGHDQVHDGDRLLDAVRESIAREPAAWPTVSVYRAMLAPRADNVGGSSDPAGLIPNHGVERALIGVRDDADEWVALFPRPFHDLAAEIGIDESVALFNLWERHILHVSDSARGRGEWQTLVKLQPKRPSRMYKLTLPDEPVTRPAPDGVTGAVTGAVTGGETALTCGVPGVTGEPASETALEPQSAPNPAAESLPDGAVMVGPHGPVMRLDGWETCRGCGNPAPYRDDLGPVHPGGLCWEPRAPGAESAPTAAESGSEWPDVPQPPADLVGVPVPRSAPDTATGTRAADAGTAARRRHVVAALDSAGLWLLGQDSARPVDTMPTSRAECVELAFAAGVDRLIVYPDVTPADLPERIGADETVRHPWASLAETPVTTGAAGEDDALRPYSVIRRRDDESRSVILCLARLDPAFEGEPLPHPADLIAGHAEFNRQFGTWWFVSEPYMFRTLLERAIDRTKHADRVRRVESIARMQIPAVRETSLMSRGSRPLTAEEEGCLFLTGLDRNAAWPTAMTATVVGIGEPRHITEPFTFDPAVHGKLAGYWRIADDVWIDPHVDEMLHLGAGWLTTGEARMLARGIKTPDNPNPSSLLPQIVEAWVWDDSVELFRGFGREIREARRALIARQGERGGKVALTLCKSMASAFGALSTGIGKDPATVPTSERGRIWRPDWQDQIQGQAQANIIREVLTIGLTRGRWPVALNVDEMVYATNHHDPAETARELGLKYDATGAAGNGWKSKGPVSVMAIRKFCGELTFWPMFRKLREEGK